MVRIATSMGNEIVASRGLSEYPRATAREVADLHERCGIFTQDSTAGAMLGSIGWRAQADLSGASLLDPCIGDGAFIVPAVETLIASLRRTGTPPTPETLAGRILGIELHRPTFRKAWAVVEAALLSAGIDAASASRALHVWLHNDDFLLRDFRSTTFTHIVANPPYLRWGKLPRGLAETYRNRLPAAWTSGDLSVAFIAKMIELAADGGRLALLSSDRWLHAAHAERFRTHWLPKVRIDRIEQVDSRAVFRTPVSAYPVIAILTRLDANHQAQRPTVPAADRSLNRIIEGWMARFPPMQQAGCEIRVGPALGPEAAFVGRALDVEDALLLPYLRPREIVGDGIAGAGDQVIRVHAPGGGLIDLRRYPKAARHLERFRQRLEQRACVQGASGARRWYRTIDRIDPTRWARDKLLLPEILCTPRIALDQAGHVPAHGIYAIFSTGWPLPILRDLLAAGILGAVLKCIAPRIGGGCKRCYKRFLSRLPLPCWNALPAAIREDLRHARTTSTARLEGHPGSLLPGLHGLLLPRRRRGDRLVARLRAAGQGTGASGPRRRAGPALRRQAGARSMAARRQRGMAADPHRGPRPARGRLCAAHVCVCLPALRPLRP
jgi:adenine-specific DNA-methyltransferase